MSNPAYATVWTAFLSETTEDIAVGDCLVKASDGYYVKATSANRTAAGATLSVDGIALTAGDVTNRAVQMQTVGPCPTSVTGLASGTASDLRVSSTGRLERATLGGSDIFAGTCRADGHANLNFSSRTATGAGTPGGTSGQIQYNNAGAFGGLAVGTAHQVLRTNQGATSHEWADPLAGVVTPEEKGAVGDGSTADQTALDACVTELENATAGTMLLGSDRDYRVTGLEVNSATSVSIRGLGPSSILSTVSDAPIIRLVSCNDIQVSDLTLKGSSLGSNQRGLSTGKFGSDSVARLKVSNVHAVDLDAGFVTLAHLDLNGPQYVGCSAKNCTVGYYHTDGVEHVGCLAYDCDTGLGAYTGNVSWVGGGIYNCTVGIDATAGGNSGHDVVSGAQVNHNDIGLRCGAIVNGFTVSGCHFFDNAIDLDGDTGLVQFSNCEVDLTYLDLTNGSRLLFSDCAFSSAYLDIGSFVISGNSYVEFDNPRPLKNADNLPSWIRDYMFVSWSFASDANDTLTAQESTAKELHVADGTITASRQITSFFSPAEERRIIVRNSNTYDVTYKWSSGTAVTVPAGKSRLVGSDGTNAIILDFGDGTGGGSVPTGTGFRHVTSGSEDAAAKLVENADVHASAGIAVSKLAAGTANYLLKTVGSTPTWSQPHAQTAGIVLISDGASGFAGSGCSAGSGIMDVTALRVGAASWASAGSIRFPSVTNTVLVAGKATGGTDDQIVGIGGSAYSLYFGETTPTNWTTQVSGYPLYLWGRDATYFYNGAGGNEAARINTTDFKFTWPISGSSENSKPLRLKVVTTIAPSTLDDYTLSASEYQCPVIVYDGTAGSGTQNIIFPDVPGAIFFVHNKDNATVIQCGKSPGSGVQIGVLHAAVIVHTGTDYKAMGEVTTS